MPSLRSRLFVFVLRNRHLFGSRQKRTTAVDWNTSIPALRQEVESGASFFGKLPEGFSLAPVTIGNLAAEWMLPPQAPKDKAVLYFHGGGYVVGSIPSHRPIVSKFVKEIGVGALVFDYRLAPEHPFPAGLEDAVAAYRWLLENGFTAQHIVFMGDSAGGGLCLATLLAVRDRSLPLPAGAVALSPWTDLKNTGESLISNARLDTLSWAGSEPVFSKYYAGDQDPGLPWISPLYGDLHDLPPLLLYVGGDERLRDDSIRFAKKAREAGVQVALTVGEGLFHCYPACAPLFPEANKAMTEIGVFIRQQLGV